MIFRANEKVSTIQPIQPFFSSVKLCPSPKKKGAPKVTRHHLATSRGSLQGFVSPAMSLSWPSLNEVLHIGTPPVENTPKFHEIVPIFVSF